ncbi:treble-clef zinc-finger protein [Nocardioides albertanoniae]|uniref:Treble-clef zinc-finger protein n=1 Tax=Nocardioides albertanoniae TaxID=1175486 RepID=A0A543A5R2_9ACTN|nr:FBP domain-containing protein [Nocardioides albertanoniae]TQL67898.1 treble-clef zinc-finger protein [Nocardioides albertanoniae]
MKPLTETDVRSSFVNLTKGATKRLNLPADLAERPWEDLDYLGWRDPKAPQNSYLVTEHDGRLCGVALRASRQARGARKTMCALCATVGDVSLLVASRAGRSGQDGNSVGTYICTDLDCSLKARGKRKVADTLILQETLSVEQKVDRLLGNLDSFVARVLRPA